MNTTEWNAGFPEKRGVYKCRVDGAEQYLVHHKCEMSKRSWWSTLIGQDIAGYVVEWTGNPVKIELND